ncbi:MAG: Holliday junction resolvase RuvX [Muribaculaceae bacterium]|nr:Holliday junction resolvase RuvX [Muribaculaceae bacterium]
MGRILAIDYGRRRCGLAVTDELRLVGSPLETVETSGLLDFIKRYIARNKVDIIIIGEPTTLRGEPSESARYIEGFIPRLRAILPEGMEIARYDERFTSTLAHRAMIDGGLGRMARRDKALVDRTAATIILNDYLQSIYNK